MDGLRFGFGCVEGNSGVVSLDGERILLLGHQGIPQPKIGVFVWHLKKDGLNPKDARK